MHEFLQIILINLAVSCDNVGVIAMATQNLPERQASAARRMGIGLSLVFKLIFIVLIGYLFSLEWLHIRIIGGVMLLYVTFHMVGQHSEQEAEKTALKKNSLSGAVISIIAADLSMSLDNVIAILGVFTGEGRELGLREYTLIISGLILCMPLLLWFSDVIAKMMEKFPLLNYLCAGYLIYTGVNIIFEDQALDLLFEQFHFEYAKPTAMLCGVLMVAYGMLTGGGAKKGIRWRKHILILYVLLIGSAVMVVGIITYASKIDSNRWSETVQVYYPMLHNGVNALYLLGMESENLYFCAAVFTGWQVHTHGKWGYRIMRWRSVKAMGMFILLYLAVTTIGLGHTFGFRDFHPLAWAGNLLLLTVLLMTYPAVFSLIAVLTRSRALTITMSLLYVFVEAVITAICMANYRLIPLAEVFPKYYLSSYISQPPGVLRSLSIIFVSALYIRACAWIAGHVEKSR